MCYGIGMVVGMYVGWMWKACIMLFSLSLNARIGCANTPPVNPGSMEKK